jgi:hypothetical protein
MLGSLLKYEFSAVGRIMLPLLGALLAASAVLGFAIRAGSNIGTAAVLVYAVLFVAAMLTTLILIIQRFSKNLLGSEGYLMFTLPVSTGSQLWNKTISAIIWCLLTNIAVVISWILIMVCSDADFSAMTYGNVNSVGDFISQAFDYFGKGQVIGTAVELLAVVMIVSGSLALKVYASIAVGHEVENHRGICSVGVFIGFSILESIILNAVGDKFGDIGKDIAVKIADNTANALTGVHEVAISIGIVMAIFGAIYFAATWFIMDRKLNLD